VLFYGPVDERSFILGKYVAKMITYILLMAAAAVFIAALAAVLGVGISQTLIKLPLMSVLLASCIISLGIMLSALTSGVTSAIFLLIVFMAAMVGIKIAGLILGLIPGFIHPLVSAAKDISVTLLSVTQLISPVEYLGLGLYAISSSDPLSYLKAFLYPAAYSAALLLLSTYIIRRRGVR